MKQEEKGFVEALVDLLSVRVSRDDIGFISSALIESSTFFSQKKLQKTMSSRLQHLTGMGKKLLPYQGYLIYAGI